VAHDFNNILAVIMGYSGLMLEEPGLGAQFKDKLETIQSAAERAIGLTRQLLIFSRKQPVQPVILDLNDTVKDLDKMLRRLINENIEMMIVPGEQIGRIRADSGYVGQVLMNLVVNARDAMPNGGKLTISINNATLDENYARTHIGAVAGDYVMLSVGDTGTGMTDAIKAHMFEAFFTTKPEGRGTGLGLATCQTIMQQSGGHIDVDSKVGKGTTFKVYFPRVQHLLGVAPRPVQIGAAPETAPL
jgi:signal transduction histidine kinase